MDTPSIFPCWGRHQRMGHNETIGRFEPFVGTSVLCIVPDLPGDDTHEPKAGAKHVLPMDGPAFYGFEVLDETEAMVALLMGRPRIWREPARLPGPVEDAVEVDGSDTVRTAVRTAGHQLGCDCDDCVPF